MPYCAVALCTSSNNKNKKLSPENQISFHRFPLDRHLAKLWWSKCKRGDKTTFNSNDRICSLHFDKNDFLRNPMCEKYNIPELRIKLNPNAVPKLKIPVQPEPVIKKPVTRKRKSTRSLNVPKRRMKIFKESDDMDELNEEDISALSPMVLMGNDDDHNTNDDDDNVDDDESEASANLRIDADQNPLSPHRSTVKDVRKRYLLKKETHCTTILDQLLKDNNFTDVTFTAEGKVIRAHKIVLCLASQYFRQVLSRESSVQNVMVFRDVKFAELKNLINFIYTGEVTVDAAHLDSFMKTAEMLEVKSLCEVLRALPKELLPPKIEPVKKSRTPATGTSKTPSGTSKTPSGTSKSATGSSSPATGTAKMDTETSQAGTTTFKKATEPLKNLRSSNASGPAKKSRKSSAAGPPAKRAKAAAHPVKKEPSVAMPTKTPPTTPPRSEATPTPSTPPTPMCEVKLDPQVDWLSERESCLTEVLSSDTGPVVQSINHNDETNEVHNMLKTSTPDKPKVIMGKCPFCPNPQQQPSFIGTHLASHIFLNHPEKTAFPCDKCTRVFLKKTSFEAHKEDCDK